MKKLATTVVAAVFAIVLAGCGSSNQTDSQDQNKTEKTTQSSDSTRSQENSGQSNSNSNDTSNSQQEMKDKLDKLPYAEYEVEADYKDKEYEAEIERDDHTGDIEAKIKDELNNERLQGKEAFDELYPNLEKLNIDGNTSKEDAISQVLKAFDLPKDYTKIEISFETGQGKKIEFEDHQ